jgi:hypothetical protein
VTFDPDRLVREQREYLLQLAEQPGWAEYAEHQARSMATEEHGMWKPLAEVADELKRRRRDRTRH